MPFPSIQATATSVEAAGTTNHTMSLPAGIVAGDLLVAIIGTGNPSTSHGWPAGWTEIADQPSTSRSLAAAYREADGTEGASINVTTVDSVQSAMIVYRITGNMPIAERAPSASSNNGATNGFDSPLHTPSGGGADFLWLSGGVQGGTNAFVAYGANYTLGQVNVNSSTDPGNGCTIAAAGRQRAASSEDPGLFEFSGSNNFAAVTISVPGLPNEIDALVSAAIQAGFTVALSASSAIAVQQLEEFLSDGSVQATLSDEISVDSRVTTEDATISILEKNGIDETVTDKTNGIIAFKSIDSPSNDNENPLILPSAGERTYSFQKWLRMKADGAFFAILNLKAYTDGTNEMGTGITMWWAPSSAFIAPTVPDRSISPPSLGGNPMNNAFGFISSSPLILAEGPIGSDGTPKEVGDHLVAVLEISPSSPSGETPQETISFAWDEV